MRSGTAAAAAMLIAAAGAATIAGAWFFELVLKLRPCPLCLEQRVPYYIAIPLALIVVLAAWRKAPRAAIVVGLVALAGLMLWGAGLAVFHAGVEWKWWPGPQECSGSLGDLRTGGPLVNQIESMSVVRCDEAAWRFLGLSLAGYNALISLTLALIALGAAAMEWRAHPR